MLQDEAFHFLRIGTFLERADNTARLLDVKFHALDSDLRPPRNERGTRRYDFYHWCGGAAFGVRLRDLPQGLSQRDPAREVAELLILRARHAALAGAPA